MIIKMSQGYISKTSRYKNLPEEEREKLKIRMAENYYRRTEGKRKRRIIQQKFVKNPEFKNRNPHIKKELNDNEKK